MLHAIRALQPTSGSGSGSDYFAQSRRPSSAENEVAVGGKTRPPDIWVTRWLDGHPLALDLTVTHPLAPSLGLDSKSAARALEEKEHRKNLKSLVVCTTLNLDFKPFAVPTIGALGSAALEVA